MREMNRGFMKHNIKLVSRYEISFALAHISSCNSIKRK